MDVHFQYENGRLAENLEFLDIVSPKFSIW